MSRTVLQPAKNYCIVLTSGWSKVCVLSYTHNSIVTHFVVIAVRVSLRNCSDLRISTLARLNPAGPAEGSVRLEGITIYHRARAISPGVLGEFPNRSRLIGRLGTS